MKPTTLSLLICSMLFLGSVVVDATNLRRRSSEVEEQTVPVYTYADGTPVPPEELAKLLASGNTKIKNAEASEGAEAFETAQEKPQVQPQVQAQEQPVPEVKPVADAAESPAVVVVANEDKSQDDAVAVPTAAAVSATHETAEAESAEAVFVNSVHPVLTTSQPPVAVTAIAPEGVEEAVEAQEATEAEPAHVPAYHPVYENHEQAEAESAEAVYAHYDTAVHPILITPQPAELTVMPTIMPVFLPGPVLVAPSDFTYYYANGTLASPIAVQQMLSANNGADGQQVVIQPVVVYKWVNGTVIPDSQVPQLISSPPASGGVVYKYVNGSVIDADEVEAVLSGANAEAVPAPVEAVAVSAAPADVSAAPVDVSPILVANPIPFPTSEEAAAVAVPTNDATDVFAPSETGTVIITAPVETPTEAVDATPVLAVADSNDNTASSTADDVQDQSANAKDFFSGLKKFSQSAKPSVSSFLRNHVQIQQA